MSFYLFIALTVIFTLSGGLIVWLYDRKKEKRSTKISIILAHTAITLGGFVSAWFSVTMEGYLYPICYLLLAIIISLVIGEFAYCIFSKKIYK